MNRGGSALADTLIIILGRLFHILLQALINYCFTGVGFMTGYAANCGQQVRCGTYTICAYTEGKYIMEPD